MEKGDGGMRRKEVGFGEEGMEMAMKETEKGNWQGRLRKSGPFRGCCVSVWTMLWLDTCLQVFSINFAAGR